MFKTLIAAAALSVAAGSAFAGGYDSYSNDYNHHTDYRADYNVQYEQTPVYKTVCEDVFQEKLVYDPYTYRYVLKKIFIGKKCYEVLVH